jgi:hypothetical protein
LPDGPIRYKNRKTGVIYEYVAEVMLNKSPATVPKDGSMLAILKTSKGTFIARPVKELRGSRFIRLRPMRAKRE